MALIHFVILDVALLAPHLGVLGISFPAKTRSRSKSGCRYVDKPLADRTERLVAGKKKKKDVVGVV